MDTDKHVQTRLGRVNRNVWAVTAASFLNDISSKLIFTLMPLFLSNVLGVSTSIIGLIDGVSETTSSLLKGYSGYLSDRFKNRKWLTIVGYSFSAVAKPILYVVTSWYGVLVVRFIDRIGKGIRTSPRDALIADSIDKQHRGIAFSLHRAGDSAGGIIGLLIALFIVLATQSQALDLSREAFQRLVLFGVVPAFMAVLVLGIMLRETTIDKTYDQQDEKSMDASAGALNFRSLNRDFRFFIVVVGIFTMGNSSNSFILLLAQERGLSVVSILTMLIAYNLLHVTFSGPLGALSDRLGPRRLIVGGWLTYGLIYTGFAFATTGTQVWILYSLYGIYYAAVGGTSKALVADLTPEHQRGTAYGYYNATVGLMALPASLLAGILWQGFGDWTGFGPSAPFVAGAILSVVAAGLLSFHWREQGTY
ncbi:MAG: MFS transporter [Chloroflexota bacterium]